MKKLEDRIIKDMYVLEMKQTLTSIILKIAGILFFGGAAVFLIQILLEIFAEEKTFNVLEIFNDDIEVVRTYFVSIMTVIFQETPKELLFLIAALLIIFLVIVLTFIRNFGKMRHKLVAELYYWRRKNK